MKLVNIVQGFVLLGGVLSTNVIEATDSNINEYLDKGIPTMLDIYASWCGHCKRLAPVYDELSELFDHAKDKVQFIKIDGDIHGKTAKKFKVEYFPTVKFLQDGEVEEVEMRELDDLAAYVTKKTGIKIKTAQSGGAAKKSNVVSLTDVDFGKQIKGKNALVAFTANWCGHCKNLKPQYEKLADIYERDEDVVIGLVDCTGEGTAELVEKFAIQSYPTILFFPASGEDPVPYRFGRSVDDFVQFFIDKKASFRTADGGLAPEAGRIEALDTLAANIVSADSIAEAVEQFKQQATQSTGDTAKLYVRIAEKILEKGADYVQKETKRVSGIVAKKVVSQDKLDELQVKLNILDAFKPGAIVHEDL